MSDVNQNETEHTTAAETRQSVQEKDSSPREENGTSAPSVSDEDKTEQSAKKESSKEEGKETPAVASPATSPQTESSDGIEITQLEETRDADEPPKDPPKGKKKKKRKKRHHPVRWVILLVIVVAAVYLYRNWPRNSGDEISYLPATATTQDLTTSDSFTGTVAAVDSQSVVSAISGAKVIEVDVEEGDTVEAGDVIAKLDTTDVEQQIKELEVSMNSTATK
ncbi:MAG: biotin/lipoyl-binding protein, partial [Lachnospiraceae bacterium]